MNDMTKYNIAHWCIITILKVRDLENLKNVIQVYKARYIYKTSKKDPLLKCNIWWVIFMKRSTCTRTEIETLPILSISFGCIQLQWSLWTCVILCWFLISHTKQIYIACSNCFYFIYFILSWKLLIINYTYKISNRILEILSVISTKLIFSVRFTYIKNERVIC